MNNYGLVLNDVGMRESLSALQSYVWPVARVLFPTEGAQLDDHHSFVVSYREDQDLGLDMHTDDSDVTLNVCLGEKFSGAGLTICGDVGSPQHRIKSHTYEHVVGRGLLHLGRCAVRETLIWSVVSAGTQTGRLQVGILAESDVIHRFKYSL